MLKNKILLFITIINIKLIKNLFYFYITKYNTFRPLFYFFKKIGLFSLFTKILFKSLEYYCFYFLFFNNNIFFKKIIILASKKKNIFLNHNSIVRLFFSLYFSLYIFIKNYSFLRIYELLQNKEGARLLMLVI